ncbi:MAG: hypothetical protein H7328_11960 [Bdellovibrio sp.]|nr:hypothetical protein [Bdellovibrio sp.]
MNVQEQILILREKNLGVRRIAKSLSLARNTVRDFLRDNDNKTILHSELAAFSSTAEKKSTGAKFI